MSFFATDGTDFHRFFFCGNLCNRGDIFLQIQKAITTGHLTPANL
jgi:hypothetical protein